MSLLKNHVTQLSFSVYESKGVFAVLLGSGLSRAAEIPTGWEITLDLIRRMALAQGIVEQSDWAAWYRETTGEEPNYSALLEELASSPEERRAILHSYIEPTPEDREAGRKTPTEAHRAIAGLVQGGYIRVIVTTNFDRLMENALRERGIEPTIVSSVDALAGAEPITHSACYILKLRGDYKDARILNTESELSGYPVPYDALDRILDEHGLIVCGWSGEWDHALRSAFLRAPNRRYSVFWASRGGIGNGAQELVDHRRARVIPITDADSFFSTLHQHVETLGQSQRQNPFSIELLINSAKRFLAKPEYRIQLDDLLIQETDRLLAQLNGVDLAQPGNWDTATFRLYVKRYEAAAESLTAVCGVLGRWGDDSELPLVLDVIRTLYAHADKVGSGLVPYLGLRSYPAVLIFTAYGLGLTRSGRWGALHRLFSAIIERQHSEPVRLAEALFLRAWKGDEGDTWKQIEGLEQRKTPLSDYLFMLFSEWGKPFMGLAPDFELIFERYEMLAALAFLERDNKEVIQQTLAGDPHNGWALMPVGRSSWHSSYASRLISELQAEPMKAALMRAGFAKNDAEFVDLFIENFKRIARRVGW
ncbi:SIR2 family protein [Pseudomonas anguilliseptica]|uniref:SIR2 family protein n=1 Tax=Pseudomonas anguilliseptica TaxID=53406 RepID=UPI00325B37C5